MRSTCQPCMYGIFDNAGMCGHASRKKPTNDLQRSRVASASLAAITTDFSYFLLALSCWRIAVSFPTWPTVNRFTQDRFDNVELLLG